MKVITCVGAPAEHSVIGQRQAIVEVVSGIETSKQAVSVGRRDEKCVTMGRTDLKQRRRASLVQVPVGQSSTFRRRRASREATNFPPPLQEPVPFACRTPRSTAKGGRSM